MHDSPDKFLREQVLAVAQLSAQGEDNLYRREVLRKTGMKLVLAIGFACYEAGAAKRLQQLE